MHALRWVFIFGLISLIFLRTYENQSDALDISLFTKPQLNTQVLKVVSGHVPGLVADFKILDVFPLYDAFRKHKHDNFGNMLYYHLYAASVLDPKFQDTYRLASSLLAFDAKKPKEAVLLLERGTQTMPNNWEAPFFGGFIAASQLQDYETAYKLMSIAARRQGVMSSAVYLAAQYLEHKSSKQDTIIFLQGMLDIMPKAYHAGIKKKITELQKDL